MADGAGGQGTAELRPPQIEMNGINVISSGERKGRPRDLFWPWFAANVSASASWRTGRQRGRTCGRRRPRPPPRRPRKRPIGLLDKPGAQRILRVSMINV
jgi:hypothetical protein